MLISANNAVFAPILPAKKAAVTGAPGYQVEVDTGLDSTISGSGLDL
jgi:hypothetical protein